MVEENRLVQTKSARVVIDDNTGMGKACSNAAQRVLASFGITTATTKFDEQTDLSCAGVLLSLPALLSNGLLNHSKDFKLENVCYTEEMIFVCLAFLSLLRVQNINQANSWILRTIVYHLFQSIVYQCFSPKFTTCLNLRRDITAQSLPLYKMICC